MTFTFDEDMIIQALEANGWRNVWDIYWVQDRGAGFCGLTTEDAFIALLREKTLLPSRRAPSEKEDHSIGRPFPSS